MNKKTLAVLALSTALFTNIYAGSCQINSGAYVGLSVGGAHLSGKGNIESSTAGVANDRSINNRLSANSAAASLFAGYGMKLNTFWLAAELSYQFDNLSSKNNFLVDNTNGQKTASTTTNGAFGGAFHLGFIANNNSIIYAILGIESRRFKVKFSDSATPKDISAVIDKNYISTAFAPGLGVRFTLSKNLSLKTEYKCALHPNKKLSDTRAGVGGQDTVTIKHSPQIHSFSVGVVYSF